MARNCGCLTRLVYIAAPLFNEARACLQRPPGRVRRVGGVAQTVKIDGPKSMYRKRRGCLFTANTNVGHPISNLSPARLE